MKNRFDPIDSEWCVWVRGDCFFFLFLHFFFFRSVCVSFSIQRGWSHTNCRGKKREPDEKTRKKRNGSHARWTGPCFSWLADQFEKENVDNLKIYTRARAHTHTHSQTQRNNEQHGRPKNFSDRWKKQRKPKIHNEAFRERFLHRPKKKHRVKPNPRANFPFSRRLDTVQNRVVLPTNSRGIGVSILSLKRGE